jgi:hypothetical protein
LSHFAADEGSPAQRKRIVVLLVLLVGMVVCTLTLVWPATTITCTRLEPNQTDCVRQAKALGVVPVGEKRYRDVQRAELIKSCNDEGDCQWSIEVTTPSGKQTLMSLVPLSSGSMVDQINAFIAGGGSSPLYIDDSALPFGILIIGLLLAIGFGVAWQARKTSSPESRR